MLCKEPGESGFMQVNWTQFLWKAKKVAEADVRQSERAARSNAQQLAVLDAGGHRAKRERERLGS